jgi:hypothetical protein
VSACPECGAPFAAAELLVLESAREGRQLYCPAGHAAVPLDPAGEFKDPSTALAAALLQAMDLASRLKRAEARLAELVPAGLDPSDPESLKHRARMLSNTARMASDGRRICAYCGSSSANNRALYRHLMRIHHADLHQPARFL